MKLSKAQEKLLNKLNKGRRIIVGIWGDYYLGGDYDFRIDKRTVRVLMDYGYVEEHRGLRSKFIGITAAGCTALAEAEAK